MSKREAPNKEPRIAPPPPTKSGAKLPLEIIFEADLERLPPEAVEEVYSRLD